MLCYLFSTNLLHTIHYDQEGGVKSCGKKIGFQKQPCSLCYYFVRRLDNSLALQGILAKLKKGLTTSQVQIFICNIVFITN